MMKLSFSDAILPRFSEGARGVLTVFRRVEPIGWEGPMSFDFGAGWTVVVRGAASLRAEPSKMPEDKFAPWIPKRPIDGSPPLLAVRQMGKGRMAVLAIRGYWLFDAWPNCPTEDAQGNHLYAFADNIKFPKPEWLLPDRRLETLATWRTTEGSYFNYVNRYLTQRVITGFWRHRETWIHVADYKLYNSFPIYMQSDRCNFGGQARLRTKQGQKVFINVGFARSGVTPNKGKLDLSLRPALGLTHPKPDLPIDGGAGGLPSASLRFGLQVPGELRHLFSYPTTYLVGPEIAIGQGNYRLGYDPAEEGAKQTRLGHPCKQPQPGWGNAWSSWHRLVPTRVLSGWSRTYACNWLLPRFRIGWHETRAVLKQDIELDPAKGIQVMYTTHGPWRLWRNQQPSRRGEGPFLRGTYATIEEAGGSTMLIAFDDTLHYKYHGDQGITLFHRPGGPAMTKGQALHFLVGFAGAPTGTSSEQMHAFARQFGIAAAGTVSYAAEVTRGRELDNYLIWRLEARAGAIEAKLPQTDLAAFLTAEASGLNDNWTVYLLDRARSGPNFRGLPIRDGRAFAQLDLNDADLDLFIGHPVLADNPNVMLLVAWRQEGQWSVEAHNRGDRPIRTRLRSNRGWTLFDFDRVVELPAGASRLWRIQEKS